jgi:hypothetical protein
MFSSFDYSCHFVLKIKQIILRSSVCLTSTLLGNAVVDGIFRCRNSGLGGICPQNPLVGSSGSYGNTGVILFQAKSARQIRMRCYSLQEKLKKLDLKSFKQMVIIITVPTYA